MSWTYICSTALCSIIMTSEIIKCCQAPKIAEDDFQGDEYSNSTLLLKSFLRAHDKVEWKEQNTQVTCDHVLTARGRNLSMLIGQLVLSHGIPDASRGGP